MVIDQDQFQRLSPLAVEWAREQEACVLRFGSPLSERQMADARIAGIAHPERVRVLAVDRIPIPKHPELAAIARSAQIITDASRGTAMGYGILLRIDSWSDREILMHQLIHVAQHERCGSLEAWVLEYLTTRRDARFSFGSLEDEARERARELCAASVAAA